MGGTPIIESEALQQRWSAVFPRDYQRLREQIESGSSPSIDPYAATSLAEFFAVSTENFFDSPDNLYAQLPDIYDLLKEYFGLDPIKFR